MSQGLEAFLQGVFTGVGWHLFVQFCQSQQSSCSALVYFPADGRTQTGSSVLPPVSAEGCLGSIQSQRAQALSAQQHMSLRETIPHCFSHKAQYIVIVIIPSYKPPQVTQVIT